VIFVSFVVEIPAEFSCCSARQVVVLADELAISKAVSCAAPPGEQIGFWWDYGVPAAPEKLDSSIPIVCAKIFARVHGRNSGVNRCLEKHKTYGNLCIVTCALDLHLRRVFIDDGAGDSSLITTTVSTRSMTTSIVDEG
jgi:hypothetical protein